MRREDTKALNVEMKKNVEGKSRKKRRGIAKKRFLDKYD